VIGSRVEGRRVEDGSRSIDSRPVVSLGTIDVSQKLDTEEGETRRPFQTRLDRLVEHERSYRVFLVCLG
jgi:hypothetical protein